MSEFGQVKTFSQTLKLQNYAPRVDFGRTEMRLTSYPDDCLFKTSEERVRLSVLPQVLWLFIQNSRRTLFQIPADHR